MQKRQERSGEPLQHGLNLIDNYVLVTDLSLTQVVYNMIASGYVRLNIIHAEMARHLLANLFHFLSEVLLCERVNKGVCKR
jgi:hypothetical protein